ncbi:hypothetical protein KY084_10935 [Stakelama sp. CBK3Z-3]|uniref:Uncharacterized protein n=1 Tax=Stakelama flava TaxID=2860338 RepID=A0ABS6XMK6_9SPHN|nr:hypothetical protein [Stakelama flava]MBW4331386.1 hypothetical protein [Stakelama flava]
MHSISQLGIAWLAKRSRHVDQLYTEASWKTPSSAIFPLVEKIANGKTRHPDRLRFWRGVWLLSYSERGVEYLEQPDGTGRLLLLDCSLPETVIAELNRGARVLNDIIAATDGSIFDQCRAKIAKVENCGPRVFIKIVIDWHTFSPPPSAIAST